MKVLFYLSIFFYPIINYSQAVVGHSSYPEIQELNQKMRVKAFEYTGVVGTPFYEEDWMWGTLTTFKNKRFDSLQLKFDVFNDELNYKRALTNDSIILDGNLIQAFTLYNDQGLHNFVNLIHPVQVDKKSNIGFFKILYQGNFLLLKKIRKMLVYAKQTGAYSSGQNFDQFKKMPDLYYILFEGDTLKSVKLNQKSLVNVLNLNKNQVKEIVAEKKLILRNEKDAIILIENLDH